MKNMQKFEWWGYLHVHGSVHVKRYFGKDDIIEANESPFCKKVVGPIMASDREDASKQIIELLTNE